jgi:hypothetical protein
MGQQIHLGHPLVVTCKDIAMGWNGETEMGHDSKPNRDRLVSEERQYLAKMIEVLAKRTGETSFRRQGAALGVSRTTLHNWIRKHRLPNESAYADLLTKAELTSKEEDKYWAAYRGAANSPTFPLPSDPASAIDGQPAFPGLTSTDPPADEDATTAASPGQSSQRPASSAGSDAAPVSRLPQCPGTPLNPPVVPPAELGLGAPTGPSRRSWRPQPHTVLIAAAVGLCVVALASGLAALVLYSSGSSSSPQALSTAAQLSPSPKSPGVTQRPAAGDHRTGAEDTPPVHGLCDHYEVTAREMSLRTQDNRLLPKQVLGRGVKVTVQRRGTDTGRTELWYVTADSDGPSGWILPDHRYWKPICIA